MSTFSETLLEYAKNPPNKGILHSPTLIHEESNRSCGDSMTIYLRLDGDLIQDFSFEGDTAIITTAAAAMFGEAIIGMNIHDILKMSYPDIREIIGTDVTPKRQMAACLALLATRNAIHIHLKDGGKDDFSDVLPQ